jgi:hypothetical protein
MPETRIKVSGLSKQTSLDQFVMRGLEGLDAGRRLPLRSF